MKYKLFLIIKGIVTLLLLVSTSLLTLFIINTGLFPFNKILILITILCIVVIGILFGMYYPKIIKILSIITIILAIIISMISFMGVYYVGRASLSINRVSNTIHEKTIQILTLKENNINTIQELNHKKIALSLFEEKYIDKIKEVLSREKVELSYEKKDNHTTLIESLISKKNEYILVDSAQIEELKKSVIDFDKKTKVIYETKIETVIEAKNQVANIAKTSFILYITGIDTYGDVSKVSRSDVNIILVINPIKNEILVVNMPRDLFLYIPRVNDYDKLTHTGLMGPDASIETLENFFDIKINYYMRLNFTSIINIIDTLGGLTVDNPTAFYTGTWDEAENRIHFPEGEIELSGKQAMVYARERMSLPNGDIDRARNQRRIIEAMIKKMISSQILFSFDSILSGIEKLIQTDMSPTQMKELIRNQIDNNKPWKIYTQEVKSQFGSSGGYYSGRQQLSVAFPIIESRLDVITQIENMLSGEAVSEKTIDVGTVDYKGSR